MKRVLVAGAAIAALVAILLPALAFLTRENPRRAGTDGIFPSEVVAVLGPGQGLCQAARVIAGTRAIELPLRDRAPGAGLHMRLLDSTGREAVHATRTGTRAGGVRFELSRTLERDVIGRVCLDQRRGGSAAFLGSLSRPGLTQGGKPTDGAITLSYYRPGTESLLSVMPEVARRIGLTRGHLGGAWRGVVIVLLYGAGIGLSAWLLVSLMRGRARRVGLLVAAVAVVNALAWGLLTPTFQVPDEPYHTSYVQDLAEHGEPPMPGEGVASAPSDELIAIGNAAATGTINFNPIARPNWSAERDAELKAELARKPRTDNRGAVENVRDYPPLYYAVMVPAYYAAHAAGGSTLDALTLMRGLGALFAGVTVWALLGFLRELFPERPLLAGGLALACAYQPVFTWIQGGVNPDAMLIPLGAVMFWLIARAWRRGLTARSAAVLGLVFAAGVLTKVSAIGFAPGFAVALAVLVWRRPDQRLRVAGAGVLGAGVPLALYAVLNTLIWGRPLIPGGVTGAAGSPVPAAGQHASGFAAYLWQYVLPPVGKMTNFFNVGWTPKDFWTPLWVGRFGWFDYQFGTNVNNAAFVVFSLIAVIALVVLVLRWRREWPLLLVFATLAGGLAGAIARAGYQLRVGGNTIFEQARYLMPLLALYAFALALVVSLLRRRAEAAAVSLLVGVSALHLLGAFILTVRRYYL